jgi:hypothetical protein
LLPVHDREARLSALGRQHDRPEEVFGISLGEGRGEIVLKVVDLVGGPGVGPLVDGDGKGLVRQHVTYGIGAEANPCLYGHVTLHRVGCDVTTAQPAQGSTRTPIG